MPIKIIKGGGKPRSAPVVEGGLKASDPMLETPKPTTNEESLKHWKAQPHVGAKQKECGFCGHHYIKPCTEENHATCQNFLFLHGKAKVAG